MCHSSSAVLMLRLSVIAWICVVCAGCGVGYRYGQANLNYSVDPTSLAKSSRTNQTPFNVDTGYHEFRFVDTTGLLLAGITNVSRQTVARQDAIDAAKNRRDTDGDGLIKVDYNYKPAGIYPGSRLVVDLRIGTEPQLTFDGLEEPSANTALTYWGADVLGEFYQLDAEWLPGLRSTLFFAVHIDDVDYETGGSIDFNSLGIDMTFGSNVGYQLGDFTFVGTAGVGMLTPVFKFLVDSPETHYLNGTLAFEALYYPLDWLGISANLSTLRTLDAGRSVHVHRGGIGVIFEYDPDMF